MSTFWTLLRAGTVVVGSSAAMLVGGLMGTAHADPAPVPVPNIGEQLVTSAANAPQVLQNLATALGAQPPAPPPLASAAIKVPQPPSAATSGATSAIPGATSAIPGASSLIPGAATATPAATPAAPGLGIPGLAPTVAAPAASAPATGPAALLPQAQLNLPQVPFLPVPLPQQVSLPGDLAALTPGGVPIPRGIAPASTPVAPVTSPNPLLLPLSGLP